MLNIDKLDCLASDEVGPVRSTLRATSFDDKNSEYMTASTAPAFDMDAVMRSYVKTLPEQDGCPRSVDALLCGKDGTYYLIEFKNGSVKKDEVLNKLYATLLMLQDVCALSIDNARSKLVFVLVYNGAKAWGRGSSTSSPSRRVNEAQHFGHIRQSITKRAKTNDRPVPRSILGIGNSIKNIFVHDYIHCDKNSFDDALRSALAVTKHGEPSP